MNVTLEAAAEREPQSPATPAYRLWTADNLARDGRYADAVAGYDRSVEAAQFAVRLVETHDPIVSALYNKAPAAALDGNASSAIVTYQELAGYAPEHAAEAMFHAGLIAEGSGQVDQAAEFYRASATKAPVPRTDNPAELARRALLRLEQTQTEYASDPYKLVDLLATSLERGDASQVKRLASTTHFAAGPVGGHTAFEDPAMLDELCSDLLRSQVTARRRLLGSGGKLYLPTRGWRGKWFVGDVTFIITKAPRGWQWTGLAVTCPNDLWLERWRPPATTDQPATSFRPVRPLACG